MHETVDNVDSTIEIVKTEIPTSPLANASSLVNDTPTEEPSTDSKPPAGPIHP